MEGTRTRRGDDFDGETAVDPNEFDADTSAFDGGAAMRGSKMGEAAPIPASDGSSSDPPTRFLRGLASHVELPPGSIVDDLEIEEELGAGAMGVVYRARHTKLGRRVAIKVIAPSMGADPQALARFAREARALATLRHPNIVDVYAFGELPDARAYFTMEYLAGCTLHERLQRGRVPLDAALDVLDQVASALEAAHAAGIVHRDLKPENTFLVGDPGERPVVKVLDWGLARLIVSDGGERTASGAVIGTALYLSPEQARGPDVDGRTDIYALGVVAYELVVGQHPFPRALTAMAALAAHLTEPPPRPRTIWPEIPAALDRLLPAMIAKDADQRPTLAQVRDVIARGRAGDPTAAPAVVAPVALGARNVRAWIAASTALALVVGIMIGTRMLGAAPNHAARPARENSVEHEARTGAVATPRVPARDAASAVDAGDALAVAAPDAQVANTAVVITTDAPRSKARESPPVSPARVAEVPSSPSVDTGAPSEGVSGPASPQVVELPVDAPTPPPKPPREGRAVRRSDPPTPMRRTDRDATINPFAKRSSGAR